MRKESDLIASHYIEKTLQLHRRTLIRYEETGALVPVCRWPCRMYERSAIVRFMNSHRAGCQGIVDEIPGDLIDIHDVSILLRRTHATVRRWSRDRLHMPRWDFNARVSRFSRSSICQWVLVESKREERRKERRKKVKRPYGPEGSVFQ
jgi:hypothetical protein